MTALLTLRTRNLLLVAFAAGSLWLYFVKASAQAPSGPPSKNLAARMLAGSIRAANGKPMEGVAVSARGVEKTFTTTVFTDAKGNYFFPVLDVGRYRVWAQAVGYGLARAEVQLDSSKQTHQDFTLQTIEDFTPQLSGTEWLAALPSNTPADLRMKEIFQHDCTYCHSPSFVLQNRFDRAGWMAIVTAMERATQNGTWQKESLPHNSHFKEELVDYLTRVRGQGRLRSSSNLCRVQPATPPVW